MHDKPCFFMPSLYRLSLWLLFGCATWTGGLRASESEEHEPPIDYLLILQKYFISIEEIEELLIAILNGQMALVSIRLKGLYKKIRKVISPDMKVMLKKGGMVYEESALKVLKDILEYFSNEENADKIYQSVFVDYVIWLNKNMPKYVEHAQKNNHHLPYIEMPPYLGYRKKVNSPFAYKLVPYDEFYIPGFLDEKLKKLYIDYLIANYGDDSRLHEVLKSDKYGQKALQQYQKTKFPQGNNMLQARYKYLLGALLTSAAASWEKTLIYLERKNLLMRTKHSLNTWFKKPPGILAGRQLAPLGEEVAVVVLALVAAGLAGKAGYQFYKEYFPKKKKITPTPAPPASAPKKWGFLLLCLLLGTLLLLGLFWSRKMSRR